MDQVAVCFNRGSQGARKCLQTLATAFEDMDIEKDCINRGRLGYMDQETERQTDRHAGRQTDR